MEPDEAKCWFYYKDHQQQGPVGAFELKKLFEQGILSGNTYIWTSECTCWKTAKSLEPFRNYAQKENTSLDLSFEKSSHEFEALLKGRPLIRFIARMFDLSILTIICLSIVSIFSPRLVLQTSKISLFIVILLLWIIFEPIILTIFGNTLGRALLHTKIKSVNGELMDFNTAFKRSVFVTAAGMGFGVPIIVFVCNLFSLFDLREHGRSTWDTKSGTIVLYGYVTHSKILLTACFPLMVFIAGFIL